MSAFLDLPWEIRRIIIDFAIHAHRCPPQYPSNQTDRIDHNDYTYSPAVIKLDKQPLQGLHTHLALSLVNHQLLSETTWVLERIRSTSWFLDIMVQNELEFWPTWLSVPILSERLDEVRVTHRMFGHCARRNTFIRGLGLRYLYLDLMHEFFRFGPDLTRSFQLSRNDRYYSPDKVFTIGKLVLDFRSADIVEYPFPPPEKTYENHWRRHRIRAKYSTDLSSYAVRPDWFAREIQSDLESILERCYHSSGITRTLYERVGSIHILVDGELQCEYKLDQMFAALKSDRG